MMSPYPNYDKAQDWHTWAVAIIASGQFFVEKKALEEAKARIAALRSEAANLEKNLQAKIDALNNLTRI